MGLGPQFGFLCFCVWYFGGFKSVFTLFLQGVRWDRGHIFPTGCSLVFWGFEIDFYIVPTGCSVGLGPHVGSLCFCLWYFGGFKSVFTFFLEGVRWY